ncbi:FkbM family methyltransferase [Litorivicinus sp.]|nr:FkbM family methyltransferase [Litorivicinus sp.]
MFRQIKQVLSGVSWIRSFLYRVHDALPDSVFLVCVNVLCRFSFVSVSVRSGSDGDYLYSDGLRSRYAADRLRGLRLWRRGFRYRDEQLIEKYGLAFADFDENDVVIDCGANYGDVYFALKSLGKQFQYLAIEPDPTVQGVLKKNAASDGQIYRIALGARNYESVLFFLSGMSGDSSVVRPDIVEDEVVVPMQTLTTLVEKVRLEHIGLLKLEAEGYEVEILRGAREMLEIVSYVAVDGSAERGGRETLDDLRGLLERHGFSLIHNSKRYVSALFERRF